MSWLLDILYYSSTSIIWGVLIGLALLSLFFFFIKGWYKDAHFNLISYIIGAVLGILLIFQCTLICGAIHIIKIANDFEPFLTSVVASITPFSDQIVTAAESREVVAELVDESPLLAKYVGGGLFTGYTAAELPHGIISEIKSFMSYYILRRVLWSLLFVVVGAVIVIKFLDRPVRRVSAVGYGARESYRVQRSDRSSRRGRTTERARSYRR